MSSVFRPFPLPLTGRQWFYLTFLQGVGAGVIDGGANFGIAYAMYHGQDVVKMWVFSKNTIAGDLGVTPIIQCLASMLITSTLVHSDLHHSAVKPLPYVYPHVEHLPDPRTILSPSFRRQQRENPNPVPPPASASRSSSSDTTVMAEKNQVEKTGTKGIRYWYWMLVRFIFEGTERNMLLARPGFGSWFGRFIWTAAQGAGIGIIFGFPIWCLAVLILGPIYGNGNMGNKWAPQVIKLVYGAIVGWVTNPVIAILALGSQADHHLIMVENDGDEEEVIEGEGTREGEQTSPAAILEEGEEREGNTLIPPGTPSRAPPSPRSARTTVPSPFTRTIPLGTPLSQRVRSHSNVSSSSRPPLTANVSGLSPLPAPHIPLATPIETPERPTYGRERGLTISSVSSGYSYALGGTGGRAKRARSSTSASASAAGLGSGGGSGLGITGNRPPIPSVTVSNADQVVGADEPATRPRAGSWDVFGRRTTAPDGVPTISSRTPELGSSPQTPGTLAALGEVRESRELDRT